MEWSETALFEKKSGIKKSRLKEAVHDDNNGTNNLDLNQIECTSTNSIDNRFQGMNSKLNFMLDTLV